MSAVEIGFLLTSSGMTSNATAAKLEAANINGAVLGQATAKQLVDAGISVGDAVNLIAARDGAMEPSVPKNYSHPSAPLDIQISFNVKRVFAIDELGFTFEVQFDAILAWNDNNVFASCKAKTEDTAIKGGCRWLWRPSLYWTNSKGTELLQIDLQAMPPAWDGNPSTPGFVYMVHTLRGTFTAPMGFKNFPHDTQKLPIKVSMSVSDVHNRTAIKFVPVAVLHENSISADPDVDSISGWDIQAASASEAFYMPIDFDKIKGPSHTAMSRLMVTMTAIGANLASPKQSWAIATITAKRKSAFYMLNYVLVVTMLTGMSWIVFFLDASSLEDRVGLCLTLVLALNVFQLILNDSMPKTGYLTPMHEYIIGSTFFIVISAIESVAVFQLNKRSAVREAVVKKVSMLTKFGSAKTSGKGHAFGDGTRGTEALPEGDEAPVTSVSVEGTCMGHARRAIRWVEANLDHISMLVFPAAFAIFTAATFSGGAEES